MDNTPNTREGDAAREQETSGQGSSLLLSVQQMPAVRTRDEVSASDGGGSGRSDSNDKTSNTGR